MFFLSFMLFIGAMGHGLMDFHDLVIRFFSAFYVAGNERAFLSFLSLFGSMALSAWGISTGFFTSNHLAIVDLEDEDDLMLGFVELLILGFTSTRFTTPIMSQKTFF